MPYFINKKEVSIAEAGRALGISRARAHQCHHDGSLQYRLDAIEGDPLIPFTPDPIRLSLACKITDMDSATVISKAVSGKLNSLIFVAQGRLYGLRAATSVLDCTTENVRIYVRSGRIESVLSDRLSENPSLQRYGIEWK